MAKRTKCEICNRTFKDRDGLVNHNVAKHRLPKKENKSTLLKKIKPKIIWIVIILALIFIISLSFGSSGKYDSFAQCLTDSNVKMFGAYWCSHCANQKELFGSSFKHVNYVECSLPNKAGVTKVCIDENINSFPTWEFADGSRRGGVISLSKLSELSGCLLE